MSPPRGHARYATPLAAALLVAALAACAGEREPPLGPWSALLVTLDTLRADALGAYGGADTPSLDRLASEGIVWDAAFSVAPLTQPAHASILTGLYPPRHGVRDNGLTTLPESATTVAEAARAAGVQTAAFVGAVVLDAGFGLAQGFDVYDGPTKPDRHLTSLYAERRAEEVVRHALAWLDSRDRRRPFFLWVHFFDPHAPYAPPPGFDPDSLLPRKKYAGEVAYADAALGALLAGLRVDGALAQTFVAFVADHGEAFGEHGEERHGTNAYDTTLHVPLVLRYPDGRRAGARTDAIASVADLAPTLAEALGVPFPSDVDGVSLHGGGPPAERGAYFESYAGYLGFGFSPLAGWVDRRGKYVHSSAPQFFERATDPGEELNRFGDVDVEPYRAAIARVSAEPRLTREAERVDDELRDEVRGLGYGALPSGEDVPDPLAPSAWPSPAESTDQLRRTLRARDLLVNGAYEEARRLFGELAAENPNHLIALEGLGLCDLKTNRPLEAIEPLQRLLRQRPELADAWFNLGVALSHAGRNEQAQASFERAIELAPERPSLYEPLIGLLRSEGRVDEARAWQSRLIELTRPR